MNALRKAVCGVVDPELRVVTIEELGILRKWNPASGQQLKWTALSDLETLWTFSGDGRVLASASDDLTVWDASSGALLTSIPQPSWVTALAFHSDASCRGGDNQPSALLVPPVT